MKARGIAAVGATMVMVASVGTATAKDDVVEGCEAMNPAAPTCTYTVTEPIESPVSGVAGQGTWVVKVKRGKQKIKLTSPAGGAPTAVSFEYQVGDKVTATAVSPGASLVAGGD